MTRSFVRTAFAVVSAAAAAACASAPGQPVAKLAEVPKTKVAVQAPELRSVNFDFDRSDIRRDAGRILKANASEIARGGSWRKVVVEGHCDERGSEEYNLALGERRAEAVKRFLMDTGLPASKIVTVSYGEARPRSHGQDESSRQSNRRVEFALVN